MSRAVCASARLSKNSRRYQPTNFLSLACCSLLWCYKTCSTDRARSTTAKNDWKKEWKFKAAKKTITKFRSVSARTNRRSEGLVQREAKKDWWKKHKMLGKQHDFHGWLQLQRSLHASKEHGSRFFVLFWHADESPICNHIRWYPFILVAYVVLIIQEKRNRLWTIFVKYSQWNLSY